MESSAGCLGAGFAKASSNCWGARFANGGDVVAAGWLRMGIGYGVKEAASSMMIVRVLAAVVSGRELRPVNRVIVNRVNNAAAVASCPFDPRPLISDQRQEFGLLRNRPDASLLLRARWIA